MRRHKKVAYILKIYEPSKIYLFSKSKLNIITDNSVFFFLVLYYVLIVVLLYATISWFLGDGTMQMVVLLKKANMETDL
jgi:hypothetical protein